ncbi:MAG TPA: N-acetylglucosamine-6-phosphate deacetylase, partial [Pyrinomonadaceae bacterium]|nr:N-acetylglucosamine-6-phosphate deacetylase [Pyrinomonadaceae bacterium]
MPKILLKNTNVVLPDEKAENVSVLIEDGMIADISDKGKSLTESFDLSNLTLFAGFIDVHIHGAVGIDTNQASGEGLRKMAKFLASQGTTAWLPTLVPDLDENYQKSIEAIEQLMLFQKDEPIARALGVHYEGVFANEKMCGALRPQFFKTFKNEDEIESLPKLKNGIHFTTLAPEVTGGIKLIKELRKQNWIVSIGHTKADLETLEKAKEAGAKHLTHFFNAMTGLHHRDLGVVGWGLSDDEITFDFIADGVHVNPQVLKIAAKVKTTEKVSLISDAVLPTGLGDGDFEIWGGKISVVNGKTQNERGSIAGSVITMLDAVRQMLSLGFSEVEVSKMASMNPAKLLGIEKDFGSIEFGKRADLVALDKQGNVKLVLIGGN